MERSATQWTIEAGSGSVQFAIPQNNPCQWSTQHLLLKTTDGACALRNRNISGGYVQRAVFVIGHRTWCIRKGNALRNHTLDTCGDGSGNEISGAYVTDAIIACSRLGHFRWIESRGKIRKLLNDDVRH